MTLGVAREFAENGIRCLSISPGPVRTPFQSAAQTSPELVQRFLDDVPMKRFGEPEEIAELVLFMCSDACAFMTSDTVYVNAGGGWRCQGPSVAGPHTHPPRPTPPATVLRKQ